MFFTTELTEDAEKFRELGKFAVAMKSMFSLPQDTQGKTLYIIKVFHRYTDTPPVTPEA